MTPPKPSTPTSDGTSRDGWMGVSRIDHSLGAHISFLMLIRQMKRRLDYHRQRRQQQQQQQQQRSVSTTTTTTHLPPTPTPTITFDTFVGLSGVYSINNHFDYEAARGVEELSPMKPACGYTRESFLDHDPSLCLRNLLFLQPTNDDCVNENDDEVQGESDGSVPKEQPTGAVVDLPSILLVHGIEDDVVPFTSTAEVASIIRSCGIMVSPFPEMGL